MRRGDDRHGEAVRGLRRCRCRRHVHRCRRARRGTLTARGEGADHPGRPGRGGRARRPRGVAGRPTPAPAAWHHHHHQRGAGTQDRPHRAGHHRGFRGRAADRPDRPALYDLSVARPEPLVPHDQVVTVAERTGPDGRAVVELTDEEIGRVVGEVERADPESIAISLLFSYAGTEHERRLTAALERLGVPISRSSALLPRFREFERASTCVLKRRDGAGDAPLPVQPLVPPARTEDHRDDLQRWHRRCRWGVPE
ncbi:MAG TPA: hydantoinase/oxoprolinase N-terminal domain-containing protein [Amycolatopsis sp.]|nr:hydantoinase/oxoprolinase N-terminal domain-containing protein [Amycolatopsis sp.]HKS47739.1 hydantoinase/oxoprolinase N-terminal domain-containing protein [Amycolatopsis sp.]